MSSAERAALQRVPVDGHVHFHRADQVVVTLDSAIRNFRTEGRGSLSLGVMLLTEAAGERVFSALRRESRLDHWQIEPCAGEPQSLVCHGPEGKIIVVCGRQIRCKDGLEVAALGTTEEYPDGRPIEETVASVRQSGAMTVLPWCFGKWIGSRGAAVRKILARQSPADLAVGDNGGRLKWMGRPALVRAAARRGYVVIPGTDPFPFGHDYRRVGSFGFLVGGCPDLHHPWKDLERTLKNTQQPVSTYGRAVGLLRFAVNQTGIQLYNVRRRSAAE